MNPLEPTVSAENLRLRAQALSVPFHIILVEPEIPPNTGNIARLCAATGSPLHLVGKLGFSIDAHAVRRAGLDYWHLVTVKTHNTLRDAEASIAAEYPNPDARTWLLSGRSSRNVYETEFKQGDRFVFGKESVGLPEALLDERPDACLGLPTLGAVRSLNLANATSIVLFEALRQVGAFRTTALG